MSINRVLPDYTSLNEPFEASTAVNIGDLTFFDASGNIEPANSRADTGSALGNQLDFAPIFAGVSEDKRLVGETTVQQRVICPDGVFDCTIASGTYTPGQMVGIARDSVNNVNLNQQVAVVTDPAAAIGTILIGGASVTTVRCRLQSKLFNADNYPSKIKYIGSQGTEQNSTPTAAQLIGGIVTQTGQTGAGTVTLPTGTQLSAAFPAGVPTGLSFPCRFANLGGGQTLTITTATGLTLVGTVAVPSGKCADLLFVNTGSNTWTVYSTVSA
jgi:hypothetical protein